MFSCPVLSVCDPMDCSMPGFHVPHHLLKFSHVHVHCTRDAIQPFHPLMPSSPSALNLSQNQRLFQRVICSHQMTKHWSFSFSISPSKYLGLISFRIDWFDLLSKGLSRVFSSTTVRKHQFLVLSLPYNPTLTSSHDY